MRLDWYDRSILSFVVDGGLLSARAQNGVAPVQFGISAERITHRFEALVDLYTAGDLRLEENDLDLVRRAVCYRAGTEFTHEGHESSRGT